MTQSNRHDLSGDPLILTIPGLGNSGPGHWQTLWEEAIPDCHRVDLGLWDDPHRNTWVNKITSPSRALTVPSCWPPTAWVASRWPGGPSSNNRATARSSGPAGGAARC